MKNSDASVQSTSIGGAFAVLAVVIVEQFGIEISIVTTAVVVTAFTTIFNYFVPADKLRSFHKS